MSESGRFRPWHIDLDKEPYQEYPICRVLSERGIAPLIDSLMILAKLHRRDAHVAYRGRSHERRDGVAKRWQLDLQEEEHMVALGFSWSLPRITEVIIRWLGGENLAPIWADFEPFMTSRLSKPQFRNRDPRYNRRSADGEPPDG